MVVNTIRFQSIYHLLQILMQQQSISMVIGSLSRQEMVLQLWMATMFLVAYPLESKLIQSIAFH